MVEHGGSVEEDLEEQEGNRRRTQGGYAAVLIPIERRISIG